MIVQTQNMEWMGANWPEKEEIIEGLDECGLDESATSGGIIAYYDEEDERVFIDNSASHTMIEGITESKKSRCCIAPLIKTCVDAGENIFVTCPKGELYMQMEPLLKSAGYTIRVLNFRDPRHSSDTWNPLWLPYCMARNGDMDACQELIDDFSYNLTHRETEASKDPFWDNAACSYISAIIRGLIEKGTVREVHMKSVSSMIIRGEKRLGGSTYINEFFSSFGKDSCAYTMASGTIDTASDTRKGITAVAHEHMRLFVSQGALVNMLSTNSFRLADLGDKPKTALFIIMSDEKTTYHMLVSTLIKQTYEQLVRLAQLKHDGVLPIRLNMILDEFSNIPCVKDFPSIISAARSRNIRIAIAIQSYSQMESRYGKNDASTIFENCANLMFLYSRNLEFLKMMSGLCGTQYRWIRGFKEERPLISVTQLQHLRQGECLIFRNRTPAYICMLPDISDYLLYTEPRSMPAKERPVEVVEIFDIQEYVIRYKMEEHEQSNGDVSAAKKEDTEMTLNDFSNTGSVKDSTDEGEAINKADKNQKPENAETEQPDAHNTDDDEDFDDEEWEELGRTIEEVRCLLFERMLAAERETQSAETDETCATVNEVDTGECQTPVEENEQDDEDTFQ